MGFDSTMVKNILLYDRDLIGDDIEKAIEFCIKTEEGWKHTFIPDDNRFNSQEHNRHFIDENDSSNSYEPVAEKCIVCGEQREEHRKMHKEGPNMVRIVTESFSEEITK